MIKIQFEVRGERPKQCSALTIAIGWDLHRNSGRCSLRLVRDTFFGLSRWIRHPQDFDGSIWDQHFDIVFTNTTLEGVLVEVVAIHRNTHGVVRFCILTYSIEAAWNLLIGSIHCDSSVSTLALGSERCLSRAIRIFPAVSSLVLSTFQNAFVR